jgi:ubiquinol-cytochrome c reductase cytochrome b subunit
VPGVLLALITVHLLLVFYHKHTQYPAPDAPSATSSATRSCRSTSPRPAGFFFVVFGVTVLLSTVAVVNPIWAFGAYNPVSGHRGVAAGLVHRLPRGVAADHAELGDNLFGYTISWNISSPAWSSQGS